MARSAESAASRSLTSRRQLTSRGQQPRHWSSGGGAGARRGWSARRASSEAGLGHARGGSARSRLTWLSSSTFFGGHASCWRRGGMRGLMAALRLTRSYRCGGGANLASEEEFRAQRERAERVLDWYRQYVQVLRRLQSGTTPSIVDAFCGGGGSSDGVRRAGGASHGVDLEAQADFVRRFGSTSFSRGDGTSWADMAEAQRRAHAFAAGASPPCKLYSTARGGRRMRRVSRPSSTRRETCWRRYSCTGGWRTCSARVGTCRRSRRSSSARSSGCGWTARVCLRLASTCTWTSGCDSRLSGCARAAVWAHAGGGGGSTSSVGQRGRRAARVISSRCRARRPGGARLTSAPMRWASIVGRCRSRRRARWRMRVPMRRGRRWRGSLRWAVRRAVRGCCCHATRARASSSCSSGWRRMTT